MKIPMDHESAANSLWLASDEETLFVIIFPFDRNTLQQSVAWWLMNAKTRSVEVAIKDMSSD